MGRGVQGRCACRPGSTRTCACSSRPAAPCSCVAPRISSPRPVMAYEGGYRIVPHPRVSLDAAVFFNDYDRLRSQELRFEPTPIVVLENQLNARTHGVELAATFRRADLAPPRQLHVAERVVHGRSREQRTRTWGTSEANDPSHLLSARSYLDLPHNFAVDAIFRFVGRRPAPVVRSYAELDLRLGWALRPGWELSLVGQNLLHERHAELFSPATPTTLPPFGVPSVGMDLLNGCAVLRSRWNTRCACAGCVPPRKRRSSRTSRRHSSITSPASSNGPARPPGGSAPFRHLRRRGRDDRTGDQAHRRG